MKLETPHIWWMRFKLLAVAFLVIVAILTLSYDHAAGAVIESNSIVVQTCAPQSTCAPTAVPHSATLAFCGMLLVGLGVNQRLS